MDKNLGYRHLEYHYNEALAKYKESSGKTK